MLVPRSNPGMAFQEGAIWLTCAHPKNAHLKTKSEETKSFGHLLSLSSLQSSKALQVKLTSVGQASSEKTVVVDHPPRCHLLLRPTHVQKSKLQTPTLPILTSRSQIRSRKPQKVNPKPWIGNPKKLNRYFHKPNPINLLFKPTNIKKTNKYQHSEPKP